MSSGFDESGRRRVVNCGLVDRSQPDRRPARHGSGGATSLVRFLVIALCCALFLALVVLRG